MLIYFGEETAVDQVDSYSNASRWKRALILVAGGTVNIIFGLLIYFILVTGNAEFVTTTIEGTLENSAAEAIGLQEDDRIIAINGNKIKLRTDIDKYVQKGEQLTLTIERQEDILNMVIVPQMNEETNLYLLGIMFKTTSSNRLYYGFWDTVRFTSSVLESLKALFTGNVGIKQFTGPVGISEVVTQTEDLAEYFYIFAVVSVSLGITNLLPFPPLDGGKIFILLIEGIIRKPIKESINNAIQMTGFIAIMALAVIVTYNDIIRIF